DVIKSQHSSKPRPVACYVKTSLIMTQTDKIRNLKDYFAQVRKRPGMYLGTISISKLHDHLQGYQMAYWFNEFDNPVDKNFFNNFNEYIYRYYGVTTNDNWKGVILEQCFGNEQTALETFFQLFDLFIGNAKTTDSKKIVLALFDKLIFRQDNIESKLGNNFISVLTDTVDLLKENALTTLKYDYDGILEQLKEKSETIPELTEILTEIEKQHTN
ncbi:MAG: hypothetical protein WBP45_09790, partial [Daejeonella sp.]